MNRLIALMLIITAQAVGYQFAAAQQFAKFFPNSQLTIESILPLSNGDILACGSVPMPQQKHSALLMRLNATGQVIWAHQRNDTTSSHFIVAKERPNGQGFVIGGWCESNPTSQTSVGMLALADTNGTLTHLRMVGNNMRINTIQSMPNGDYHFGGGTMGLSMHPSYIKTDSTLVPFEQAYQQVTNAIETAGGVEMTEDGWITMANGRAYQSGLLEITFSRHAPGGLGSFYKVFYCTNCQPNDEGEALAVKQLPSGNHLCLAKVVDGGSHSYVLMRIAPDGTPLTYREFNRNPSSVFTGRVSMRLVQPNTVMIWAGRPNGAWMCKSDTLGNLAWVYDFIIPNANSNIKDIHMLPNGDILVAGTSDIGSFLVQTNTNGYINCPASPDFVELAPGFWQGYFPAAALNGTAFTLQSTTMDSSVHYNTIPSLPSPTNMCNPPCANSISAQNFPVCTGSVATYCSAWPLATGIVWTFNGSPAGNSICTSVTHNTLGLTDTLSLSAIVNGCITDTSIIINVGLQYNPSFTHTTHHRIANFTHTTPPPYSSLLWHFGDGNTSTAANPSHTYAVADTYTVCLDVTGDCETRTTCDSIPIVCPLPTASFNATGLGPTFQFQSTAIGTQGMTHFWTMGDGNTSTLIHPSHTYATPDMYNVCLIVNDSCGADTSCQTINYNPVNLQSALHHHVKIWPSPVRDHFQIAGEFEGWLSLYDVNGKLLLAHHARLVPGHPLKWDISHLTIGIYYLQLQSESGQSTMILPKMN
jgi:hypothetical protein